MKKKAAVKVLKKPSKRALCVGINDYPYKDNDLNGCVNDAKAWAGILTGKFGFLKSDVKILLDSQATRKNMIAALEGLLAGARSGDVLIFTNSSHGSYVADKSGDEEKYDEVLCPYDIEDNHIKDDEIRELIVGVKPGVRITVILDNCHSGSGTRNRISNTPDDRRTRFLSPSLRGLPVLENPRSSKPKAKVKHPESKMKEILLSGCKDNEYSYDAMIGGTYHGAMTYYAIQAIKQANYKLSYSHLYQRLTGLITDYPQHPQLEGKPTNKKRQIFG